MLCESHGSSQQNNLCLDDIQVPIFFPKSIFTVGLKMIFLKLFFFHFNFSWQDCCAHGSFSHSLLRARLRNRILLILIMKFLPLNLIMKSWSPKNSTLVSPVAK